MKILIAFVVGFLTFLSISFAADCNVKGVGLNRGQKYSPPGQCLEYTCSGKGKLSAINCASSPGRPGCRYVPENRSKRYPQCCPRWIC